MKFNAEVAVDQIIQWIRDFFETTGGKVAVIGISGGKDSAITAALCAKALGKENVIGVLMPNQYFKDKKYAIAAAERYCGKWYIKSIGGCYSDIVACPVKYSHKLGLKPQTNWYDFSDCRLTGYSQSLDVTDQAITNLPARLRMCVLYYVAQCMGHGRVANTCNLSEDWVGYATRYGDGAGDFAPLGQYTVTEVKAIGHCLGVPAELVEKVPSDGLQDKTDEDNLGFTYSVLDKYIREGVCEDPEVKAKIDKLHELNKFKLLPIPYAPNCQA